MLRTEGRAATTAALASAAVLALQVLLPRLFSVLLWYHLGFLAVSLALLGFAAGGLVVARAAARSGQPGGGLPAPALAAAAALSIPIALALVVRVPLDPVQLLDGPGAPLALLLMSLLLAVPFALLGTLVCAALHARRQAPARVYAATFLGGAAGAALGLVAMDALGAPRAAAVAALLPLAALALAGRAPRAAAVLSLAAVLAAGALLAAPETVAPLSSRKHFPLVAPEQVLGERWNAFSRVTFYENPEHHGLWALSPAYAGPLPDMIGIVIDAWAVTSIVQRAPGSDSHPVFAVYPPTLAFEGAQPGFDALVLGAGGGIDVHAALAAGAGHVTAVEINPLIVDAVRGRFAGFCGGLYDDPRVTVVVGEGRAVLERDDRLYDRIVLSGVDTFAASEAGAFALSENYLYTVEAFRALLAHLRPGGVIEMTRWWFEPPRQTLRLALTAAAVLREQGVPEPGLHLFIARAGLNSIVLLARDGLTAGDAERLRRGCAQRGCDPVYGRETPSVESLVQALSLPDPSGFIADYPYRIEPTTDDRPFFFEYSRPGTLFRAEGDWIRDRLGGQEVLLLCLAALLVLAAPLVLLARGGGSAGGAGGADRVALHAPERAAFVALGFGYMLVEIPLMQQLSLPLGHPVLAVAVVLVALLVWSGCGALLAGRLGRGAGRAGARGDAGNAAANTPANAPASAPTLAAVAALLAALAVSGVLVAGHGVLSAALTEAGLAARVGAVVMFLAVPGLLLGAPFPLALAPLGSRRAPAVPLAFLWNGIASVVAGPVAVLLAMAQGFTVTLLAGAGCYLAAALLLRRSHRQPHGLALRDPPEGTDAGHPSAFVGGSRE